MMYPFRPPLRDRWLHATHRVLWDTQGHTLAETTVALALFVTVLMPAGAFLGRLVTQPVTETQIQALALAQATLETMRTNPNLSEGTVEQGWSHGHVVQVAELDESLLRITVAVYRTGRTEPLVKLATLRPPPRSPSSANAWTIMP